MNSYTKIKSVMTRLFGILLLLSIVGCEPEQPVYEGPNYIMFSSERYDLGVIDSEEWFEIPIAATRTADHDRNVGVEVIAARSSAIYGKHYTIESTTVTIPAGEYAAALRIKGAHEAMDISNSVGITLRLVVDKSEELEDYNTETEIYLHKCCPFDINAFTGYAVLTSTWAMQYMNAESLLVHTHIDSNTPNTIVVEDMFYAGYDISITFNSEDRLEPFIEMADSQVVGSTGEAFGTIYGDGKLMMIQTIGATSYYSSCEGFLLLYATMYVDGVGTVGAYANVLEWISDDEAERIMREGF